jgi:hypothetical protein
MLVGVEGDGFAMATKIGLQRLENRQMCSRMGPRVAGPFRSSSARSLAIVGRQDVRLRVLSNPLGCVMLGNETLDYFRFAIGP